MGQEKKIFILFFQAEDGIRDQPRSRGLGDVYKRQVAGQLLIVVQTPNRFEGGSMLKSMTAQERTQKTLDEIGIVYDIVDAILVSEPS